MRSVCSHGWMDGWVSWWGIVVGGLRTPSSPPTTEADATPIAHVSLPSPTRPCLTPLQPPTTLAGGSCNPPPPPMQPPLSPSLPLPNLPMSHASPTHPPHGRGRALTPFLPTHHRHDPHCLSPSPIPHPPTRFILPQSLPTCPDPPTHPPTPSQPPPSPTKKTAVCASSRASTPATPRRRPRARTRPTTTSRTWATCPTSLCSTSSASSRYVNGWFAGGCVVCVGVGLCGRRLASPCLYAFMFPAYLVSPRCLVSSSHCYECAPGL